MNNLGIYRTIDASQHKMEDKPRSRASRFISRPLDTYMSIVKFVVFLLILLILLFIRPHYPIRAVKEDPPNGLTILLWNDVKHADHWNYQCGCLVTTNRYYGKRSINAVVINADRPYLLKGLDKIKYAPNHLKVFAAQDPLIHTQNPITRENEIIFNYTMTYRLDSDLVWSNYYFSDGKHTQKRLNHFVKPDNFSMGQFTESARTELNGIIGLKHRLVMYMMYPVNDYTLPESMYLRELRKEIPLDALRACTDLDCVLYKFMLVFEPSGCSDFVHPDIYLALSHHVVPIVFGSGNLSDVVPDGSYINASQFHSAKHLANYLKALNENPQEYQKFFWWRAKYELHQINKPYCALCKQLNKPKKVQEIGQSSDFIDWWTKYKCNSFSNPPKFI